MKLKTVMVNVTQEDISDGLRFNAFECPVAIALRRATGKDCACNDRGLWNFSADYTNLYRKLPKSVRDLPRKFDQGKPVTPISFKIRYKPQ